MAKKSKRGAPPKIYDAAEWAVKLFKENPPHSWTEHYLVKRYWESTGIRVSRGTMHNALKMAEKIHPEDWERWGVRPHREDPRYLGPVPPGQGVVHYRKDLGSWFLYSHEEAIQEEAQRLWLEWRLANPLKEGNLGPGARLVIHDFEDILQIVPKKVWDTLSKREKLRLTKAIRPTLEVGIRRT